MSAKQVQQLVSRQQDRQSPSAFDERPNEGYAVPLEVKAKPGAPGGVTAFLSINASRIPAPERRYSATMVGLSVEGRLIKLLFAQSRIGGGAPRSLLVVVLSTQDAFNFVRSCRDMKEPSIGQILEQSNSTPLPLDQFADEPDATVEFRANLVLAGLSNDDTCLDFYRASPYSMTAAQRTGKLNVDPVVRVELQTGHLASLLDRLETETAGVIQEVRT